MLPAPSCYMFDGFHLLTGLMCECIQTRYVAIIKGKLEGYGTIDMPVDDKPASTRYEVVQVTSSPNATTVLSLSLHCLTVGPAASYQSSS